MHGSPVTKSLLCLRVARHAPTALFLLPVFVNLLDTPELHLEKPLRIVRGASMRVKS